jgi:hypothetical protein
LLEWLQQSCNERGLFLAFNVRWSEVPWKSWKHGDTQYVASFYFSDRLLRQSLVHFPSLNSQEWEYNFGFQTKGGFDWSIREIHKNGALYKSLRFGSKLPTFIKH